MRTLALSLPTRFWCEGAAEDRGPRVDGDADARLVKRFLETRDPRHFEALIDRHQERVYRLILAVLGREFAAEAEELAQEVFLTAYHKLHTFRHHSQVGTWLCAIARRRAIDRKRRVRYRAPHVSDEVLRGLSPAGAAGDPLAQAVLSESHQALEACIRALPDPWPAVLRLYYWMEQPIDEIAESLGMAPGTVKSHLHRARQRLERLLREKGLNHV